MGESDRDGPERIVDIKISRPIKRIDYPEIVMIFLAEAGFFGKDLMIRKIFLYLPKDDAFAF